ncbi:MAG: GHKL domain-containing protein, partial [SAR324 cluster bacterium]|nr:GHKL domain-containing protein [SAR324 cluster bacterium]
ECYPQQLNQVFLNLLVNAAQAIKDRGEIVISTEMENNHVVVKIKDDGRGIPPEQLSHIFEPFYTTKKIGEGTGLGLSVSYNIIQKHHGTMEVKSEVGKGTEFTIRLPVSAGESEARGKK